MSVKVECEVEIIEQDFPLPSVSPPANSDPSTDGDTVQSLPGCDDKSSLAQLEAPRSNESAEPKAKKRRKQSKPLKIQNPDSPKYELNAYSLADAVKSETIANDNDDDEDCISFSLEENRLEIITDDFPENNNSPSLDSDKASLKGHSLSRVANALFNKAVKANNNTKSKESSLQSLADLSSPESTEDISSSNEYKMNVQNAYSQMSALLNANPLDISQDPAKFNTLAFILNPEHMAAASPPVPQSTGNFPISQRSFITSNGVKVFNPEAYCELCEKEFCNKYFLKTHKANKHGICSVETPNVPYVQRTGAYKPPVSTQVAQQMINQMCENGATFGSADSFCHICQKYFCNKYFLKKHRQNIHGILDDSVVPVTTANSVHVPVIASSMPSTWPASSIESASTISPPGSTTKDEDTKLNVSLINIKNSLSSILPLLNGTSPQITSPSFSLKEKRSDKFLCELCNIEFCDKIYLDAHKINKHGSTAKLPGVDLSEMKIDLSEIGRLDSPSEDSKESFKGQMCTPCMKNFSSAETFQLHMLEVHGATIKTEEDNSKSSDVTNKKNDADSPHRNVDSSNGSDDVGIFNCPLCSTKFKDKGAFIIHLEKEHSVVGSTALDMCLVQDLMCDMCSEQFSDKFAMMSHKLKSHGVIPPLVEAFQEGFEGGDIFSQSAGRATKSGGSSFCQICNKELCNKYFMKTHMLKMHGIDMEKFERSQASATPTSVPIPGGVQCEICLKYLCSKYFLKIHKQNVHGLSDESQKPSLTSSISLVKAENTNLRASLEKMNATNDSVSSTEDLTKLINGGSFSCEICGQEFSDKLTLQVHLVNKHVKLNETKTLQSQLSEATLAEKDALKAGVLPCSCCSYVHGDDAMINLGARRISCIVCNITYTQNVYHTHHLSHGVTLPISKTFPMVNGIHNLDISLALSNNNNIKGGQPRKLKRFRCSKCDKTFRTKVRCLHHIQVMHKNKKSPQTDQPSPSKRHPLAVNVKKHPELKNALENGIGSLTGKGSDAKAAAVSSAGQSIASMPFILPKSSDVIMQPFHLSEPKTEDGAKEGLFVPSLVYLPVSQKVSETMTVAFTLTPA